jgi:hypothetical protein
VKRLIRLINAQQGHRALADLWFVVKPYLVSGHTLQVKVTNDTRSLQQNAAQWPILEAFSKQLLWPVNGHMVYMTDEEWKDVLTAAFKKEQVRLAMGLDGGVVMLGHRTSEFEKDEFSEWIDFLKATAAERGVNIYPEKEAA